MKETRSEEILKMAILLEKRGKAFYEKVAEHTDDEDVANIFQIMAKEEQKHIEELSDQFKYYKKHNKFREDTYEAKDESKDSIANVVLSGDMKEKISGAGYEAAAISAAIDMETKAIELYSKQAKEADDENEKKLFQWLADWEKEHHQILDDLNKELKEKVWYDHDFWPF